MPLRVPLIAHWSPGARFNLGGPAGWLDADPLDLDFVYHRAITLFEAAFTDVDEGFIVAQYAVQSSGLVDQSTSLAELRSTGGIDVRGVSFGAGQLLVTPDELIPFVPPNALALAEADMRISGDDSDSATAGWAEGERADLPVQISPRTIDYRGLLRATVNREAPANPKVQSRIFFVNERKRLVFNVPDDRYADVVSVAADELRPIVASHVAWLESAYLPRGARTS